LSAIPTSTDIHGRPTDVRAVGTANDIINWTHVVAEMHIGNSMWACASRVTVYRGLQGSPK